MFMLAANEVKIEIKLSTVSPLLVREGRYGPDQKELWQTQLLAKAKSDKAKDDIKKRMPAAIPLCRTSMAKIEGGIKNGDPHIAINAFEFYIPGSSMRGAWRSHLERNFRGMTTPEHPTVCDPLDNKPKQPSFSCSEFWAGVRKREEKDETSSTEGGGRNSNSLQKIVPDMQVVRPHRASRADFD